MWLFGGENLIAFGGAWMSTSEKEVYLGVYRKI